jgi:exodeoxyribonuclease III
MRLYSWNVNGIRAAVTRGFLSWLEAEKPDVVCLQETKARRVDLPQAVLEPPGYVSYWAEGERRGYSGVATYTHGAPKSWHAGLGVDRFDTDGRVVVTDFGDFELYNVYFPNGKASPERLAYKLEFYAAFLAHVESRVSSGHPVIFCGDVNTAHQPIDIARPKENEKISGFLPEERACLDRWVEQGWIDSFRHLYPEQREAYSWWSMRTRARERNIGWRLDYFFVHQSLMGRVKGAGIASGVTGADHCPIWLEI